MKERSVDLTELRFSLREALSAVALILLAVPALTMLVLTLVERVRERWT